MSFETVHEFEIDGCRFYLLWKPGGCLLRSIENDPDGDNETHHTVLDLFLQLYDDTENYELSLARAISMAPVYADVLKKDQRIKEAPLMEKLYQSASQREQNPVYKFGETLTDYGKYPFVWSGHNCNIFVRLNAQWWYACWARSFAEAEQTVRQYVHDHDPGGNGVVRNGLFGRILRLFNKKLR